MALFLQSFFVCGGGWGVQASRTEAGEGSGAGGQELVCDNYEVLKEVT